MNDTWEWDGNTWIQRFPTKYPSPRAHSGIAIDPATNQLLLFGGISPPFGINGRVNDMWTWTGSNWAQVQIPSLSPPPRHTPQFSSDPDRGRLVLFSGAGTGSAPYPDTWEYSAGAWSVKPVTTSPSPREHAASIFAWGRTLVHGGLGLFALGDLWAWDGSGWSEMAAGGSPGARYGHSMAFLNDDSVIMFGGCTQFCPNNETWLLRRN